MKVAKRERSKGDRRRAAGERYLSSVLFSEITKEVAELTSLAVYQPITSE